MNPTVQMIDPLVIEVHGLERHGFSKCSDNTEVYYAVFGKGPTKVLLLMGIATSGLAWKNQIEYLVRMKEYEVCIVDNRGCGRTRTPSGRLTTKRMAKDMVELLDTLGWQNDKFHLVGNSLGGMIAQEIALMIPDKLATFTLIATHAGGWKSYVPPWKAALCLSRSLYTKGVKNHVRIVMETVFSKSFLEKPGIKENLSIIEGKYDTVLDFYFETLLGKFTPIFAKEHILYLFAQQVSAVYTHNVSWERLTSLRDKFPTLVIVGTGDKIICPSHSTRLAAALGGDFLEFDGAGHAVTEECLDEVNEALHRHFSKSKIVSISA